MVFFLLEMFLLGIFATVFMDILAKVVVKKGFVSAVVESKYIGRWVLHMLKGKFTHGDISLAPAWKNEERVSLITHFLIGIGLAGVYLLLEMNFPVMREQFWMPFAFGVATILLPWFWLFPSIGIGYVASKSPRRKDCIILSIINHANFGIGMTIWVVVFRPFFA
jgi:hypothetical protein